MRSNYFLLSSFGICVQLLQNVVFAI